MNGKLWQQDNVVPAAIWGKPAELHQELI